MLSGETRRIDSLRAAEREEMFQLMCGHYAHTNWKRFTADLAEKQGVFLLYEKKCIRGFSTYKLIDTVFAGEKITLFYSGDTIIHQSHWGSSLLFKLFYHEITKQQRRLAGRPFYWLLISKGFRTYLILPLFFRTFYPCYDKPTPSRLQRLMHQAATEKFGHAYCKESGIIQSQGDYLIQELTVMGRARGQNPHVDFFLKKNPGWKKGDELVCLTSLQQDNLRHTVRRLRFAANEEKTQNLNTELIDPENAL